MSAARGALSKSGFPFTPSRFKGIPQAVSAEPVDTVPGLDRGRFAINLSYIAPESAQPISDIQPINFDRHTFARPSASLRLVDLDSFAWGVRGPLPRPRTRGEQVLIYVTEGAVKLDFPRATHLLGPDSLFFIPAGTAFATRPLPGCRGHVLLIAPDLTRDLPRAMPDRPTGGGIRHGDTALRQMMHELAIEARRGTRNAAAAIDLHLGLLALRLDRLEPARPVRLVATNGPPDLPLAERFLRLAPHRLSDGSTIADMADELGVTTAQLDAACRHKHGKRAIDVTHDLRLHRAVRMLREGRDEPARIARILGYSSLAHLSRCFVAATGRLPNHFRAGI